MNTVSVGKLGEDAVCKYLTDKGIEIIERNYHSRYGEIDIIAKEKDCLIFVEVKTRKNSLFGNASEYVTKAKQQKIIMTVSKYLKEKTDVAMRFDVAEVYYDTSEKQLTIKSINYIENAFICEA